MAWQLFFLYSFLLISGGLIFGFVVGDIAYALVGIIICLYVYNKERIE